MNNESNVVRLAYGIRAKASGSSRTVDVIASTDSVDLAGDMVVQDWDLGRYQKNPVVLYSHNYAATNAAETLPIGFSSDVAVLNGQLRATLNFVDAKANPLAELVYQGFVQQSIRAVSVGFVPKVVRAQDVSGSTVYALSGNELLEISVCPIPMNGDAVRASVNRSKSLGAIAALAVKGNGQMSNSTNNQKRYEDFSPSERRSMMTTDRKAFDALLTDYRRRSGTDPHGATSRVLAHQATREAERLAARQAELEAYGRKGRAFG